MLLTKEIVKAGRALLDWTQHDLARLTGLSIGTISRFEAGTGMKATNKQLICDAMEQHGLEFIEEAGTIVGVKKARSRSVIRAGRAILDWTQEDLSEACGLHIMSISKIESGTDFVPDIDLTIIREAMAKAGLEFILDENSEPAGVKKKTKEQVCNG